jgi:hypothetical protein
MAQSIPQGAIRVVLKGFFAAMVEHNSPVRIKKVLRDRMNLNLVRQTMGKTGEKSWHCRIMPSLAILRFQGIIS